MAYQMRKCWGFFIPQMRRQCPSAVQGVNSLLPLISVTRSSDGKSAKVNFSKLLSELSQGWQSNSSPWRPTKKTRCHLTQKNSSVTKGRMPCLESQSSETLSLGCWATVLACWATVLARGVCFPLLKTSLGIQAGMTQGTSSQRTH